MPSEAQWEYACRAGSVTPFEPGIAQTYAGLSITPDEVNYEGATPYGKAVAGENREKTIAVKQSGFHPNKWGLWQMHGNVDEWCADVWHDSHEGAVQDGRSRQLTREDGVPIRVIRGGSRDDDACFIRSAYRGGLPADYHNYDNGFRCARRP